ncbi:hypothetical protein [Canibacter zhoujuaniae]|uniref:hypothetical protein n=1 Tax=Canibacter zhoujuaniae TaxID=2708343 RepID=UPI00141E33A2|nr:hypothetical protein [Canibacter zhoujuaniae]
MTLRNELHPEHIYRVLEQTLIPPVSVQELDPDIIESAVTRLSSTSGSPSESYLVNSEFTAADLKRLPSAQEAQNIRNYFFSTTVEGFEKSLETRWARNWSPNEPLGQLLSPAWTNPVVAQGLFGVDLLVLFEDQLWRQIPSKPGAIFEQNVPSNFAEQVAAQLHDSSQDLSHGPLLILVGSHVRVQFTHGVQATRAMMQSAGMVIGALTNQALSLHMRPSIISHFNNSALNRLVSADGVDRAVATIFAATVADT